MSHSCNHCAYFEQKDSQVTPNANLGACRVNPPSASTQDQVAFWPMVNSNDWCGSFEGKQS